MVGELIRHGGWNIASNNIFVYGFAFEGKKVLICGGAYSSINWENIANKRPDSFDGLAEKIILLLNTFFGLFMQS